ncbi:MAG TPA: FAD/NAD(P)-binding protein [Acidimicrobiales bacterium]
MAHDVATEGTIVAAAAAADPMLPSVATVVGVKRETGDTWTIALVPRDGPPMTGFEPGQFNMVWAFGVGEAPLSISSDPQSPILLHTIRSVGVVTRRLCNLAPGDEVGLRGPYGEGWGMATLAGRDVVVVAGGIGLAPLRPVIYRLLAERDRYGRLLLLLGARTPSDIPFGAELDRWRDQGMQVDVTVDYAEPGWSGPVGVVTTLVPRAPLRPAATVALVCGPEVMMRFAAKALIARGVTPGDVRVSLERNMKCGLGHCGHCQLGAMFVCKDGPVLAWPAAEALLETWER